MPDGRVQWIDNDNQVVHLVRRGREYLAPLAEVDSHARIPGARVHFDVDHTDGVDRAANVTLRTGTRTSRRQRRFGDLTGAHKPGAKTKSASGALGVDVSTQPVQVAKAMVEAYAASDGDGVLSLFAADATVTTTEGEQVRGHSAVRAYVQDHTPDHFVPDAVELHGDDECVDIVWPTGTTFGMADPTPEPVASRVCIDHGHIVAYWDRIRPAEDEAGPAAATVLVLDPRIPDTGRDYVVKRFDAFSDRLDGPILFRRVKMDLVNDPANERHVNASATFDVDGRLLRAHVGAATVTEATDTLVDRLSTQVERVNDERHSPVGRPAQPGSWRHGNQPTIRPGYYERPEESRELVRHKSYADAELTPEEALWDMTVLDYDFFLFTELGTGQDCMLDHAGDRLVLHRLDNNEGAVAPAGMEVDERRAPTLTVRGAIERLDANIEPHVFFRNELTGRGSVVYRRFDGHYGLITLD